MLLDYQTLHSGHAEHFIDPFVKKGYTVFSSGLLIAEWGSKKAVKHAEHLIQLLLRQETSTPKTVRPDSLNTPLTPKTPHPSPPARSNFRSLAHPSDFHTEPNNQKQPNTLDLLWPKTLLP